MENPTAYYLQAALTFHQQSTYGNYPEPRPADLWGDTATVNKEQSLAAPASGRPVDAEHLDRIWRARRSRRTRSTRLIRKTLVEALTSAMAPSSAGLRPYPSAGGCYSASAYCYVSDVQGLEPGAYRFDPSEGSLLPILLADRESQVSPDAPELLRTTVLRADTVQAVLFLVADMHGIGARYGERGYRYALIEAGHLAQNLALAF